MLRKDAENGFRFQSEVIRLYFAHTAAPNRPFHPPNLISNPGRIFQPYVEYCSLGLTFK